MWGAALISIVALAGIVVSCEKFVITKTLTAYSPDR
jgi:hypothetical protein